MDLNSKMSAYKMRQSRGFHIIPFWWLKRRRDLRRGVQYWLNFFTFLSVITFIGSYYLNNRFRALMIFLTHSHEYTSYTFTKLCPINSELRQFRRYVGARSIVSCPINYSSALKSIASMFNWNSTPSSFSLCPSHCARLIDIFFANERWY